MTKADDLYWKLLRVCTSADDVYFIDSFGGVSDLHDIQLPTLKEVFGSKNALAAVRRVRSLDVLSAQEADMLFSSGIADGGCVAAFRRCSASWLSELVSGLHSKLLALYPLWRLLTQGTAPGQTNEQGDASDDSAELESEEEDEQLLLELGFDPERSAISMEELLRQMKANAAAREL